jgi:hypothetical protein
VCRYQNVGKYFPKDTQLNLALIEKEHCGLVAKSVSQCNAEVMRIVRQWDMYGSTFYPIVQSYTDKIPGSCFFAINRYGIHIIAKMAAVTFSSILSLSFFLSIVFSFSPLCQRLTPVKVPLASHSFNTILNMTPSETSIMIVADDQTKEHKYVLQTTQASEIIAHVTAYREVLSNPKQLKDKKNHSVSLLK